ncbi:hypothetical protein AKJ50_01585 [candidate division MSBL1 archaeon SCGC-AAA382A13]|uniref:Probable dihydroorotate dehydrogenase B (NAD(+)), electron transfer subunit n=1 Tax=candidate division MSBL1 archaeon SCGC-AAA382A13 TaxID=1698279 RepID=A0A133VFI8_9EURY|nr:hypothetical protein AKJ50_01585 [candidate division MSBL1 archaeon SCGC-AAA382A13]
MENLYPVKHKPKVYSIKEIVRETPKIKSFYVNSPEIASNSKPGQFLMIWVVGTDEVPMAVSTAKEEVLGFTVEKVGDATSKLHELSEGDLVGIRGPYGNGFDFSGKDLLIVGGGCGLAPLAFAAELATDKEKNVTLVITAEAEEKLLFKSRFEKLDAEIIIGTEDGSAGAKGITPDIVRKALPEKNYDSCLICGPEKMMLATAKLIEEKEIPVQVSLDRYMKCGIGLCGSCSLDPSGHRVCIEGPVFDYDEIKDGEFGEYRRDSTGRKTKIQ